jgi:hypothetical protein
MICRARVAEFDLLVDALIGQAESRELLYIPEHRAKFHEVHFPSELSGAFPSATKELVAAGNALAFGLYTASVFHCMRAAEIGVRILAKELGVSFPDRPIELAEWHTILENVESKIKGMRELKPRQHKDEELNFYSQAAVQFMYFKDAWRVRVAHARETYEETPATRIYDHTVEFFEVLSKRFRE